MKEEKKQGNGRVLWLAAWRVAKTLLLILFGYLVQVCAMPYIKIAGVTPNFAIAVTAVVTVCFGIVRAGWAGMSYGILMEAMVPTRPMFSLLTYPFTALLCSSIFSDRSAATLEYQRSIGKAGRNKSPYLRTVACAATNMLMHEVVNVAYVYLRDGELTADHLMKALIAVAITSALTALVMVPLRRFLGFKRVRREKKKPLVYKG